MKPFFTKLLSFVIIFILLLVIGISISYELLNNERYYKLSDNTNFVIFGHSRPECAFNDSFILNMSNFCSSGETFFYTYLKARKIIPNNKQIKAVFIEFENGQIDKKKDSLIWDDRNIYARFPLFFPLLKYSEFKFLWQKNSDAILNCAPKSFMNEMGYTCISTFFIGKGIKSNNRFGGYKYLVRDKTDSLINNMPIDTVQEKIKCEISETNITSLSKIIELCKLNNVKVFLIRSPILSKYIGLDNEPLFMELLNSKFADYEFLDFKDFPLKTSDFGDFSHLNYKGAKIFSIFFNNLIDSGLLIEKNKQEFINNKISEMLDNK